MPTLTQWTVHLARKYPTKAIAAAGGICLAAVCGYHAIGPLGAMAAVFLVTSALADFLLPVRYTLTPERATARTLFKSTSIEWERVKRCYLDDCGVKLSTLDTPSRLEAFRGLYLRFGDGPKSGEQVIEAIKTLTKRSQDAVPSQP